MYNHLFILNLLPGFLPIGANILASIIAEGPGLDPENIVLPVRYFFIRSNSSEKINKNVFEVDISGINAEKSTCRLWKQILDRRDGSFIVRYRLYETCYNLKYIVSYQGVKGGFFKDSTDAFKEFPVTFPGPVNPEDCICPQSNVERWLANFKCPGPSKQMADDLAQYTTVDFREIQDIAVQRFNNSRSSSVCHYAIKSNRIYRTCYGEHTDFKMFMDEMLLSLTRKVVLPDLEFYSNLGDWPLMKKGSPGNLPMFSWCGSSDAQDIVMPTYDLTVSTLGSMDRVSLDILSVQGNIEKQWNEKEEKAFWRGRDSSPERLKLIKLSRKYSNLINASLTSMFFYRDQIEEYSPLEKHISFFKFFDYKYQLCLDGTVAAYRFPYLLAGDALVFKQDSKYYEYFYSQLEPWKHFIPLKRDLSDLIEKLEWALENDQKAQEIANAGREFVLDNILPQHIYCYYVNLLNEWSKKLKSNEIPIKGMELVEQNPNSRGCSCSLQSHRDEL